MGRLAARSGSPPRGLSEPFRRESPLAPNGRRRDNMTPSKPSYTILAGALVGSVVEWYDLFVYGSLVVVLSGVFFPMNGSVPAILPALGAFVAGAAVRPVGGAVFGRLGDKVGRKFAFIVTLLVMGAGSVVVGLLPTYKEVGIVAPIALVSLRVMQGLALGGEYGGGVIYMAENSPDATRGYWSSFTQAAATLGLILATAVVVLTRLLLGNDAFAAYGWRLPFLGAILLLVVAVVVRWRLRETALFAAVKDRGETSKAPLSESLARQRMRTIAVALVVVSGAAVVWHTAQFYTSIFMQSTLEVGFLTSSEVTLAALLLGAPFYVVFGRLSDKIGRLKVILGGCLLGGLSFYPSYYAVSIFSKPSPDVPVLVALLFVQVLFSAMCYGPLGAFLVELFPARIRYTSVSISHGVGTGDVGDATLIVAPLLVFALGDPYAGLIWSTAIPVVSSILGFLLIKETRGTRIWEEVGEGALRH